MKRNLAALLILGICCFLSCGERETKLFNGKNLDGWAFHLAPDSDVPATDVFGVKDGVITISGQPFGYMITEESYDDYKLHLEWRWPGEPSNSGIFLHAEPIDAVWPRCAEVNLMNGRAGDMISSAAPWTAPRNPPASGTPPKSSARAILSRPMSTASS